MNHAHRLFRAAAISLLGGPVLATDARPAQAAASDSLQFVEAVWKTQSLDLWYNGSAAAYSCGALRDRLSDILQGVGARDTLVISMAGCSEMISSGRIVITLQSPVEATSENIEAITSYNGTQALLARLRKERLDGPDELQRFPATWRTISMSRDRNLKLGPSDCELVEHLRRDVFPHMSIRVEYDRLRCSATFGNVGQPQLRIVALVAITADAPH